MGKIGAAMASVSTEYKLYDPALHTFEIEKVEEKEKDDKLVAYIVHNKITTEGHEDEGKTFRHYINLRKKDGDFSDAGLASIKRYFETIFGKEVVASWSDDDYDTDMLHGQSFRAQLEITSYTKEGETEPRRNNDLKAMAPL